MDEQKAFEIVFDKLQEIPMFCGIYDAKNGYESYMYGIATVIEYIASRSGDERLQEYDDTFFENMENSRINAMNKM